jgi:alpha-amylase
MSKSVILQGFNWGSYKTGNWNKELKNKIRSFKQSNIDKIWLPPISKSHCLEGYFPDDYYNYDSAYGNDEDLWNLIETCNDEGVDPIVDVISWTCLPTFCREKFNFNGTLITDDSKWDFLADWATELHYNGVKGYRLDMAGIVPVHFINKLPKDTFIVGELWETMNYENSRMLYDQDCHRQYIVDYIDNTGGRVHAFDFTLKGVLQEALNNNEYWRLCGPNSEQYGVSGWYPKRSVTFIDNHDTLGQHMWPFGYKYIQGYAYLLFHDGIPCIYYDHLDDTIKYLLHVCTEIENDNIIIHEANEEKYVAQKGSYFFEFGAHEFRPNTIFEYSDCKIWKC